MIPEGLPQEEVLQKNKDAFVLESKQEEFMGLSEFAKPQSWLSEKLDDQARDDAHNA